MADTSADLTVQANVVALMESSKSEVEWNSNCDKVKKANNGYPSFWYQAILVPGIPQRVANKWNGDAGLRVTAL